MKYITLFLILLKCFYSLKEDKKDYNAPVLNVAFEHADRDELSMRRRKEDFIEETENLKAIEKLNENSLNAMKKIIEQQKSINKKMSILSGNSQELMKEVY